MINTQIHYGSDRFEISRFKKIQNRRWNKPRGGLWSSSVGSIYGWRWFCESECFRDSKYLSKFFKYRITGKIYEINSAQDLYDVPAIDDCEIGIFIDFEKLRDLGYSAIHLTWPGQCDTRWSNDMNLYGWDVESTLLLNPSAIEFPKIYIQCKTKRSKVKTTAGTFGSIKSMYRYYQNKIVQSIGDTVISEPIFSAGDNRVIGKLEIRWKEDRSLQNLINENG